MISFVGLGKICSRTHTLLPSAIPDFYYPTVPTLYPLCIYGPIHFRLGGFCQCANMTSRELTCFNLGQLEFDSARILAQVSQTCILSLPRILDGSDSIQRTS